jgi:branched-chain amino acid transport system substrate-binding protein
MMKRSILGALAAVALMVTAGQAAAQSKEPLKLPFPYIFSGPLIEFGERVWNEGLLPGVAKVNANGGIHGRPLEFYKVDVRFPETAPWISEFRRLCADQDIPVIFGVGATKSLLAIYEETGKCKIPVFNPSSGGHWPHKDFADWIFRYQPMPADVMPTLLQKAKDDLGIKNVALTFTLDDEFAVNNANVSRRVIKEMGLNLVTEQSFKTKETNFASQVAAIRAAKPDAVVMHHQPGDAGTLLLQLRERGVEAPVITDTIVGGADFWKLSKGGAKGSIGFSLYNVDDPRPAVQEWVTLWRKNTGKADAAPDGFVTAYYDAVQVLAHVLNNAKDLSRASIRESFLTVKGMDTISGTIEWDSVGDVRRPAPILVQVGDNGKLRQWK